MKILSRGLSRFNISRRNKSPRCLSTKVFDQYLLSSLIYGCETWTLILKQQNEKRKKLKTTQRNMEIYIWNNTCGQKKKIDNGDIKFYDGLRQINSHLSRISY